MKSILFSLGFFFITASLVSAHEYVPLSGYYRTTDKVLLTKVVSVEGRKVTFATTQTLVGEPVSSLTLTLHEDETGNYTPNSEWLLVSNPNGMKDIVGESFDGPDGAWIPGPIVHFSGDVYVETGAFPNSGITLTKLPGDRQGMTIEQVKIFLEAHPHKVK